MLKTLARLQSIMAVAQTNGDGNTVALIQGAITDITPLAGLVSGLSELAADFRDVVTECDLNPVLIRKGSGDVRVVDALFVAGGR